MSPAHFLGADRGSQRKLIALLSLVVLAVVPIMAYLIWSGYQAAIHSAETRTHDYAAILEARLDATLRRADADLLAMTHMVPVAALSQQAVPRYARELNANLDDRLFRYKEIAGFRVTDRHGDTLYSSTSASVPYVSIADRSYFIQLRDNPQAGLVFSEVVIGRSTGRPVLAIARALKDARGNFMGIVYALLELQHFQALFRSLAIGEQGVISLRRSEDQRLVLRWPDLASQINKPLDSQNPITKRLVAGERMATLQFAALIDGTERIFSFQVLENYPFYITASLGRKEVLAEWRARSLAVGGLGLLLLSMLVWLLHRLWRALVREQQVAGALKESERFARASLDALSSHIAVLDGEGRIIATNQRWRTFAQQNGQSPQQVSEGAEYLGVCQQAGGVGDDAARVAATLIKDLISGQRLEGSFEYPCHSPQEQRWFVCRGTRFAGDGPVRVVMAHENVTVRKQAEEALRRSEDKLAGVFRTSPVPIFLSRLANGLYLDVNQASERTFGWSREDSIGRTSAELGIWVDPQARKRWVAMLKAQRRSEDFEAVFRTRSGDLRTVLLSAEIIELDGEEYILGLVYDITERKQAEEALRLLNEQLETNVLERTAELQQTNATLLSKEEEIRSVVENLVDCVISIDDQGVIQSANLAVEKVLGFGVAEVLGRNVSMLMPEPHRGAHDGYLERYHHTGQAHIIGIGREVEGLHKNGTRIAMELSVNEYFVHGQRFFTGILRDIRERVRIMKDLEQARLDAEQASRAKSAFLAAMSHEIRTPMNGVVGMIDVLQQTSLKGYQVEIVDTIRDSAYALLAIIEDILDFSKIEAGKLELEQAAMSVSAVVEQVCSMMDHLATKKGVEFRLFTDPAIPEQVLGDALRLRQVLINLVNNAIKFSSGEQRTGQVSLRVRLAGRSADGVTLEMEVSDNGIGMDDATLARLFSSFSQADVSTTRRFGGTGLGLAISSQLVQLMGGTILVQSVPGQGSTFTVRLPFLALPASSDALQVPSQVAGLSCLVVGSAPGLADDLAAYLQHGGAVVERAPDLALARERSSACPAGLSVWLIDAGAAAPSEEQLRAAAAARPDQDVRFVLIGRGYRRQPRAVAPDLVVVDGNVLQRQTLFRAVAIAVGRAPAEAETELETAVQAEAPAGRSAATVGAPAHEQARRQGRLILVAEDNETNQLVIEQQLGLLGYAVDMADDGRAALARWRSGDYAMLLTDLHMPEMDGYQLAAAIRTEEKGLRHTPIVALSANALAGEAERCLEVGMDDYLSKPTPLEKLKATLNKWLPIAAAPALDLGVLKGLVGDDVLRIDKFLRSFQTSSARIAADLRAACQGGQAGAAGAAAHKLKSSARAVGALALGELCEAMEQAGMAGDQPTLVALLPGFEQEMVAVAAFLDSLLQERQQIATTVPEMVQIKKSAVKVMLLDDEPFMLELLSELLETLGYTSLSRYASAAAALDSLADPAGQPDLILLDLNMPEMDGIEFVRHLVERRYAGSLVLISGEDERTLQAAHKLVQAHQIEVLGHLQKPVSPQVLAALLMQWSPPVSGRTRSAKADYAAAALRVAIANGELVNYYQPKVALTDGHLVGVETLVRWRHPSDGLVFPDQFIGVAEAHGLIDDLTRVVLHDALAQARVWRDAGLALRVAVNVSMDNLVALTFADFVVAAAAAAGVPPPKVVLEVTESRLMADLRVPLEILTRLRLKRFRLSIDDFGTGHSSLAQLRDMPFDELKIDRSFVHGAHADPTLRAIFEANLNLARQLGIEVVAEGVEDRADWDFLRRSGCDLAQGYFVARPMPAAELLGWIAAWEARLRDEALAQ